MKRKMVHSLLTLVMLSGIAAAQRRDRGPVEGLPRIVARLKLTNQTGLVSPSAFFTPKTSGLFRASMVITVTQPKTGTEEVVLFGLLGFTDVVPDEVSGCWVFAGNRGQLNGSNQVVTFAATGGKPFKFSTITSAGKDPGDTVYDVFVVVERLTKIPSF
jgi:hypothetical protein